MAGFGMTVAQYNKKPNAYLSKIPGAPPTNLQTTGSVAGTTATTVTPSVDNTPSQLNTNTPQGNTKSALGGSTAPAASGMLSQIQSPIFQPIFTSDMGTRQGSVWGRENSINNTTAILNDNMQKQVDARNQQIGQYNQNLARSQAGDPLTGDFAGDMAGSGLDAEQMQNARTIAQIGKQRGLGDNAIQIALATGLAESGLRNLHYGDRDSQGIFQQRPSQGWGSIQQVTDPTYATNKFFDSLQRVDYNRMAPWQAAQAVQRSAFADGSNYQAQWNTAQRAYQAMQSFNKISSTSNQASGWINTFNNRYVDYDGKFGAQCVDLYNYYTAGFVGGRNIFVNYAPEIFNNYDTKSYNRYGATQTAGHMGDVAVFRPGGATRDGHVAIVVGDNGNGTLRVLQANATAAGPNGPTIISNISKATLMGYLRPLKLGG